MSSPMRKNAQTSPQQMLHTGTETDSSSDAFLTAIKIGFVALGLYALVSRLWAAEDAYITFRYIDNLLHSYGLVYNIGERVEGFTHPLWLLLVAIPAALGTPIRAAALLLSLGLAIAALILLTFRSRDGKGNAVALPLALVLLLTHTGFRDFSVSGLEFPLVCLLLVWFYQSYQKHDLLGKPILHGTLLALLYLARPELILLILSFYAVLAWQVIRLYVLKLPQRLWHDVLRLTLPLALLASGYHLFRWLYYDAFFPNTYYAKDGLGAYWSQGIKYFLHFWHYSPILLLASIGWVGLLAISHRFRSQTFSSPAKYVMLAQAALLAFYISRLGGDFMAYRFLLPSMVILTLAMADSLDYLIQSRPSRRLVGAALLVGTSLLVLFPLNPPKAEGFIADERQFYDLYHPANRALFEEPVSHKWYQLGLQLRQLQEGTQYPLVIASGNIGYLGFAAGPKVEIVDLYGLVDREGAHNRQPDDGRGRPGHERKLTLAALVDRRVTIATTPFTEWNSIMSAPFGAIITLDPAFLRYFPDKVTALREYKRKVKEGMLLGDSSFEFLKVLEDRYGVQVESL
jgi:arabinofuranosyltransferase